MSSQRLPSRPFFVRLLALALVILVAAPRQARAHGLFGHVHVTGWAVENLPPGELRDFFASDPELMSAALMGATLPDTGYALGTADTAAYGEYTHWEPFIHALINRIRTQYGPTYDTHDEKMLIAFMLGAASHGLQDEMFDSTFSYEAEQREAPTGQEILDPATDGFLVQDGHARLYPGDFIPYSDLLPIYATLPEGPNITQALIQHQVDVVKQVYVNPGFGRDTAEAIGEMDRPMIPWTAAHYLDPAVAGAHGAEILATLRHMQALWDRVHGNFAETNLVVHHWPDNPRRLRESDHTRVGSWVTFVLGKGIQENSATATLVDSQGVAHPFTLAYTRWGGTSRIVRFKATADYVPGATYTATLQAGATLVDGSVTATAHSYTFQVECATPSDPACPALPPIQDPLTEQPSPPDAGMPDAGSMVRDHAPSGCSVSHGGARAPGSMLGMLALAAMALVRRRVRPRERA